MGWHQGAGLRCLTPSAIRRHRYGGNKAITLTVARLDEALYPSVIANGLTYGLEAVFNGGVTDRLNRPYLFTEFLLGNHAIAVCKKIRKRVEYFWA
jgi:hypothetical protein